MQCKFYKCYLIIFIILLKVGVTMISRIMRAVIMGPPGAGKGTISKRIVKDFGLIHLSSGDLLREHIDRKSDVGILAKKFIDQGTLVPDNVMVDLITSELRTLKDSSWLLDGFPRTVSQAKALYEKESFDVVVNLNIPFDIIIDRIKGRWIHPASGRVYNTDFSPPKTPNLDDITGEPLVQREDDKPKVVLARLETYNLQTKPILEYYRSMNLLMDFHGKESNEIWPKIHEALSNQYPAIQYTEYH